MIPQGSNLQNPACRTIYRIKIPVSSIKEKENSKKGTNHCYTQQLGMMLSKLSMYFKRLHTIWFYLYEIPDQELASFGASAQEGC